MQRQREWPASDDFGAPPFRKHFRQKKVYLYRSTRLGVIKYPEVPKREALEDLGAALPCSIPPGTK